MYWKDIFNIFPHANALRELIFSLRLRRGSYRNTIFVLTMIRSYLYFACGWEIYEHALHTYKILEGHRKGGLHLFSKQE